MPLRNFFEALGEFFDWTFQVLPALGNSVNYLFMLIIAGYGLYWFSQMNKQAKAGER